MPPAAALAQTASPPPPLSVMGAMPMSLRSTQQQPPPPTTATTTTTASRGYNNSNNYPQLGMGMGSGLGMGPMPPRQMPLQLQQQQVGVADMTMTTGMGRGIEGASEFDGCGGGGGEGDNAAGGTGTRTGEEAPPGVPLTSFLHVDQSSYHLLRFVHEKVVKGKSTVDPLTWANPVVLERDATDIQHAARQRLGAAKRAAKALEFNPRLKDTEEAAQKKKEADIAQYTVDHLPETIKNGVHERTTKQEKELIQTLPMVLHDSADNQFEGRAEEQSGSYVLFVEKNTEKGRTLFVVPVSQWYTFKRKSKVIPMSLDEAEMRMKDKFKLIPVGRSKEKDANDEDPAPKKASSEQVDFTVDAKDDAEDYELRMSVFGDDLDTTGYDEEEQEEENQETLSRKNYLREVAQEREDANKQVGESKPHKLEKPADQADDPENAADVEPEWDDDKEGEDDEGGEEGENKEKIPTMGGTLISQTVQSVPLLKAGKEIHRTVKKHTVKDKSSEVPQENGETASAASSSAQNKSAEAMAALLAQKNIDPTTGKRKRGRPRKEHTQPTPSKTRKKAPGESPTAAKSGDTQPATAPTPGCDISEEDIRRIFVEFNNSMSLTTMKEQFAKYMTTAEKKTSVIALIKRVAKQVEKGGTKFYTLR
ncbi:hypothetical protein Pelo_1168 [Pelomyxa schiedti]|nr:hypothetical protein Pelo_1168 [Pelomyxa schiedti]